MQHLENTMNTFNPTAAMIFKKIKIILVLMLLTGLGLPIAASATFNTGVNTECVDEYEYECSDDERSILVEDNLFFAPPTNDNSANATTITHTSNWCSGLAAYTTVEATGDGAKPTNWAGGPYSNVWFKFQATTTSVAIDVKVGGTEGSLRYASLALHSSTFSVLRSATDGGATADIGMSYEGLTIGSWYYINVDNNSNAGTRGTFTLCVSNAASSDYPSGAVELTNLSNWCSGLGAYTTMIGTPNGTKPSRWVDGPNNNVWFKFQATTIGIAIDLKTGGTEGSLTYPRLALHDNALAELRSATDGGATTDLGMSYEGLTIGSWYYISVDNSSNQAHRGTFTLCINNAATFDYPSGAIVLTDLNNWCSGLAAYTTMIGTPDGTKPSRWTNGPNNNVWFKFQATTNAVSVDLKTGGSEGSLLYPRLALHDNALAELRSTTDGGATTDLGISYEGLTVGSWYYINVDNSSNQDFRGTFTLCLNSVATHDYPSQAIVLTDLNNWCSGLGAYSTIIGTPNGSRPTQWLDGPNNNVWFKFQATTSGVSVDLKIGGSEGTLQYPRLALHDNVFAELKSLNDLGQSTDLGLSYDGLTVGAWYYINVDNGANQAHRGTFTLCVNAAASQDYASGAVILTDINNWCSGLGAYTTLLGTPDGTRPTQWSEGPNYNVWFKFQATTTSVAVGLKTGGTEGTLQFPKVALHNGSLGELRSASYKDTYTDIGISYEGLTIGDWYYINVDNANGGSRRGTFTLCVDNKATQDYPSGAVVLTNLNNWCSGLGAYTTIIGTPDGAKPLNWGGGVYYNVWFKFQATSNAIALDVKTGGTEGTLEYAKLALHNSSLADLQSINFNAQFSDRSITYTNLVVGDWYYVNVDNASGAGRRGTFTLCANAYETIPNVPTSFSIAAALSNSITLNWLDNSAIETGYQIERSLSANTGFTVVGTTSANAVSYTDTGLNSLTTYYYRIRTISGSGNSAYTSESSATTQGAGVDIVWNNFVNTSATGNTLTKTSSSVGWIAGATSSSTLAAGQDGWVEFNANPGQNFIVGFAETNPDASFESINYGMNNNASAIMVYESGVWKNSPGAYQGTDKLKVERIGSTIYYKKNDITFYTSLIPSTTSLLVDVSIQSASASISGTMIYPAPSSTPPPNPPSGLTALETSSTSIDLSWIDESSDETGFRIERSLTTETGFTLITTTAANVITYSDAGLTAGTTYYYRIKAINGGVSSAYSFETTATTPSIPAPPTGLTVTAASASSVSVSWTDSSTDETGFQIERSLTSGSNYVLITTTAADAIAFTDSNLTEGTAYFYRVRAINLAGNSAYTSESTVTTLTPAPPFGLLATATSATSINLSWSDGSNVETGFQIERSFISGSGFSSVATAVTDATAHLDDNLAPNTTYFYRIRAIASSGSSPYTLEASATTPQSIPTGINNLVAAVASPTSVDLTWTDNSSNELEFEIERSLSSGVGFTLVTTVPANSTSFTDTNLTSGNTYYYQVRAVNGGGASAYSPEVNANLPLAGANPACANVFCDNEGGVGIGTSYVPAGYKLAVNGKIMAEGVKILLQSDWPDYVFGLDYKLKDIPTLKNYITENGHLPNVPSAKEIEKEGVDLGEINVVLLEKIEELSLYLIKMEERIKALEGENKRLKEKN
jgi:fibronectin type 3 domain-containing protein